jgi:hypothetical protein
VWLGDISPDAPEPGSRATRAGRDAETSDDQEGESSE